MTHVSVGGAWAAAWQLAPREVLDCTLMTRSGLPIGKLRDHGVLRAVLGPDAPASLIGRARKAMVSRTEAEQLADAVRSHAAELDSCHLLFEQVQDARMRLRLGPRHDAESNAMLVKQLWTEGVTDQEAIDQAVERHYQPRLNVTSGAAATEALQVLNERLQAAWPAEIPDRSEDALRMPDELIFWHNHIDEEQWLSAVDWVNGHELRGWEQDLGLSDRPQVTCPSPIGTDAGLQPLDRSLRAWQRSRAREARNKNRALTGEQIASQEIICATSPLGLNSAEARAVILLGYWLVAFQDFVRAADDKSLLSREQVNDIVANPTAYGEVARANARYTLMMRGVWGSVEGLARGQIKRFESSFRLFHVSDEYAIKARVKEHNDGRADQVVLHYEDTSLGDQMLHDPLRSYMKRLWATVHTYTHRVEITAEVATRLLRLGWERWIKDVVAGLGEPAVRLPVTLTDRATAEEAFLQALSRVIKSSPNLVSQIMGDERLGELGPRWQQAIKRAGISPQDAAIIGVGDLVAVRNYLRKHLKSAPTKRRGA